MRYKAIAFDGNNYYLSSYRNDKITRLDENFNVSNYIQTNRAYHFICYDYALDCFWAAENNCSYKIYKLDKAFKVCDIIYISAYDVITGIAVCSESDNLLISLSKSVVSINKKTGGQITRYAAAQNEWIFAVCSVAPYIIFASEKSGKTQIKIMSGENEYLRNLEVSPRQIVEDLLFIPNIKSQTLKILLREGEDTNDLVEIPLDFLKIWVCNYSCCKKINPKILLGPSN
ncbi:MAG: hypothetical protein RR177_05290 [Oscillospiraceae bacterium]